MTATAPDERYLLLTRQQAAERCQVSLSKLDQWAEEYADFPIIREPHFVRIGPVPVLEEWLARLATQSSQPPQPPVIVRRRRRD